MILDWNLFLYRRILASTKGDRNGYLSVYLELADPASLRSGWRREVKFRLTLVNKIRKQSTKVLGDYFFLIPSLFDSICFERLQDIVSFCVLNFPQMK